MDRSQECGERRIETTAAQNRTAKIVRAASSLATRGPQERPANVVSPRPPLKSSARLEVSETGKTRHLGSQPTLRNPKAAGHKEEKEKKEDAQYASAKGPRMPLDRNAGAQRQGQEWWRTAAFRGGPGHSLRRGGGGEG
ncbi:unnamed protein product [Prorocentrum cordatum]|uniref:Uncharacterized protein n=1 Tax=Prorocentrum cordatum TaxID=2364126 RepID=A0ABN9TQN3_9DINO|nr:unnamed protein product [Polarella glacialis]